MDLTFRNVPPEHLDEAIKIEEQGFPPDEAATLESFRLRQNLAGDLFLGAYHDTRLVAYVCSTLSSDVSLTHASMSTHVPGASSVCIHSICVAPAFRRHAVGLRLLREYITRLQAAPHAYARVVLITHEHLRSFYEKAGFEFLGPSAVVHGSRPWFEMRLVLGSPVPSPAVYDALQRPSNNNPRQIRSFSSFPGGVADVSSSSPSSDPKSGPLINKFDLLCPREGCSSLILKSGVAKVIEAPNVLETQLDPVLMNHHATRDPLLPALPPSASGIPVQWWLVSPSAMDFENIGFSRPVDGEKMKLKLLVCAECNLGPLGWCKEGGTEFWLVCSRVGYRALD
ncbi:acyl-CoA N-acyltransferase [Mycena pura]|uniref:Acyl-CoA N-acyltransferase n=1 Tax=Mycena pura TaxID=153505 RepID=A0AAD6YHK3_9AGAR|nr:acyl-CoA N-acyltransferase [Mycena pura]